jgi:integrase
LKLLVGDVDLHRGTITVRETKFHKSRCLPLHASVVQALAAYREVRDRYADPANGAPFFVSHTGGPLPKGTVHGVFERLRWRLGWRARGDYAHPRIHDLRHTMAVRRLQLWHESDASIDHAMFWLCTYLGHAKITSTYWYLTGVPELMNIVGTKFENFALQGAHDE